MEIIFQTTESNKTFLQCDLKDSIKQIKTMLEPIVKIPSNQLELAFKGEKMEDDKLLENFSVKNQEIIKVSQLLDSSLTVYIEYREERKLVPIKIDQCQNVRALKGKIKDACGIKSEIQLFLVYKEKFLLNEENELLDLNILSGSHIKMVLRP